jgi:slime mold repeat-containing protein
MKHPGTLKRWFKMAGLAAVGILLAGGAFVSSRSQAAEKRPVQPVSAAASAPAAPAAAAAPRTASPTITPSKSAGGIQPEAPPVNDGCVEEVAGFKVVCTANDIQLTGIIDSSVVILDDGCAFPGDTVTFTANGTISLTANERFDIGIYLSTDGDPNGDTSESGSCQINTLNNAPAPPFVDLDGDACGDIDNTYKVPNAPLIQPIGPVTIQCIDSDGDGKADLPHCETWRQPGDNDTCNTGTDAPVGAPSKCNCGVLTSICIAVDDGNPCTIDFCDPNTGEVVHEAQPGKPCGDQTDTDCDNPDVCDANGVCQPNPASSTTSCTGSSNGGACDANDSCDGAGNCIDAFQPASTTCRPSAGQCDVAESCNGTSGSCPADGFQPSTHACTGTSNGGACDANDSCDGAGNCVDGFKPQTTTCRESAGQCDVAESCTGSSGACPANGFAASTTSCTGTSNGDVCDANDSCDGAGNCVDGFQPATTTCRASTNNCDPAESCTGSSGACPADTGGSCEAQITPTQVTCSEFASGTAPNEPPGGYTVKSGAVSQVNPGVIFYYSHITMPAGGVLTFTQSNSGTCGTVWKPMAPQSLGQVKVFTASCGNVTSSSTINSTTGQITTTVTGPSAGTQLIVGIKYSPGSLAGQAVGACHPTQTYDFSDSGGSSAAFTLLPKN